MENDKKEPLQYHPDIIDPPIKTGIKKEEPQYDDLHEINDIRTSQDFKSVTFSNYKKTDVKSKLIECLLSETIEPSCYWSCELICAGHFSDLWEIILYYISKYIHLGNPNIAIYINMRCNVFKNIMNQGTFITELEARNNQTIRKLFSEIICVLALSPKKPSFEQIKIKSQTDFDQTQITSKLKADDIGYIQDIFQKKDPRELFIALNEFAFSISEKGSNMANACYWIEWCLEFETICKKRKTKLFCEPRNYKVDNKLRTNIIWLIWDIIIFYVKKKNNNIISKIINSLLNLFTIKYSEGTPKKRRYLLYYAIELMTEPMNNNIQVLPNKNIIQAVTTQINTIYKQIKRNEQTPKTEYLFNGLDRKKAIEKSMKQMELVNSIENFN
tara:strand:+ start:40935 stop:42092 length:1158 start_codon:yes stop_codon:yes gene_type:complete